MNPKALELVLHLFQDQQIVNDFVSHPLLKLFRSEHGVLLFQIFYGPFFYQNLAVTLQSLSCFLLQLSNGFSSWSRHTVGRSQSPEKY